VVAAARAGDQEAWGELFDAHYPALYRFFRSRVPSTEQAEDLASDVFLDAFRAIDSFRWQGRPFEAWLFGIARNKLASYYRDSTVRADRVVIEHPIYDEYLAFEVRDILGRLRPEHRTALELRFLVGLSGEEAAAVMARSHGAFRALLLRAVRAYRAESEHDEPAPRYAPAPATMPLPQRARR
jgi:RNA polymerase sigma-70 factor (ECF subfamily)